MRQVLYLNTKFVEVKEIRLKLVFKLNFDRRYLLDINKHMGTHVCQRDNDILENI